MNTIERAAHFRVDVGLLPPWRQSAPSFDNSDMRLRIPTLSWQHERAMNDHESHVHSKSTRTGNDWARVKSPKQHVLGVLAIQRSYHNKLAYQTTLARSR